jgi:hypothetical protein
MALALEDARGAPRTKPIRRLPLLRLVNWRRVIALALNTLVWVAILAGARLLIWHGA